MSDIKLNLRMPDGKFKDFVQTFVPVSKTLEYFKLESDLYVEYKGKIPQGVLDERRIEFVAGLFEDETVTKELILNGLDTTDTHVIMDIINERVMGVKPEEKTKKKPRK